MNYTGLKGQAGIFLSASGAIVSGKSCYKKMNMILYS